MTNLKTCLKLAGQLVAACGAIDAAHRADMEAADAKVAAGEHEARHAASNEGRGKALEAVAEPRAQAAAAREAINAIGQPLMLATQARDALAKLA